MLLWKIYKRNGRYNLQTVEISMRNGTYFYTISKNLSNTTIYNKYYVCITYLAGICDTGTFWLTMLYLVILEERNYKMVIGSSHMLSVDFNQRW